MVCEVLNSNNRTLTTLI